MSLRRQLRALLLATMATVGLFAVGATPATAAPAPAESITLTISSTSYGIGIQNTIWCSINVQNPHKSSHVPGTVNVISRVDCTAPVASISEGVWLYRDGALVSSRGARNYGVAALQVNTTTACVNGNYVGEGLATVYFPAGYYPPAGTIGMTTLPVPITC